MALLYLFIFRSFGFFDEKQRHCLCFRVLEKECYLGKFKSCLFDIIIIIYAYIKVRSDPCFVNTIIYAIMYGNLKNSGLIKAVLESDLTMSVTGALTN